MTTSKKLYAERRAINLEPHFSAHMDAMTSEGLHSKFDIAKELAWRDMEIERLRAEITKRDNYYERPCITCGKTSIKLRCKKCFQYMKQGTLNPFNT